MKKKMCPKCGKLLHPLGYARHMAMHRDARRKVRETEDAQ